MSAANVVLAATLRDLEARLEPAQLRAYRDAATRAVHAVEFGYARRGGTRLPEAIDLAVRLRTLDSITTHGIGLDGEQLATAIEAARAAEITEATHRLAVRREAEEAFAAASAPSDPDNGPGSSWAPVPLHDVLDGLAAGTISSPAPTIGYVDGADAFLIYLGMVNGLHGISGSGKSFFSAFLAKQQLADGETVVWVDYEDAAESVISRLLELGANPALIAVNFYYIRPTELAALGIDQLLALVERVEPTLVVIDSTGEALATDGADPNSDDDVARWIRAFPRRIADLGPAVLLLDHTTKAAEDSLWPIGSQRKRAAIGGAAYLLKPVKAFAKGQAGHAVLITAKDRHGHHKQGAPAAELHFEPRLDGHLAVTLRAPRTSESGGDRWRPTALMERASKYLEEATEPLSLRGLLGLMKGKVANTRAAIDALEADGYITITDGPNRTRFHAMVKPYRQADDPASDAFRARSTPGQEEGAVNGVGVPVFLEENTGLHHPASVQNTTGSHLGNTYTPSPQMPCQGCGNPVPAHLAIDGNHASCATNTTN